MVIMGHLLSTSVPLLQIGGFQKLIIISLRHACVLDLTGKLNTKGSDVFTHIKL